MAPSRGVRNIETITGLIRHVSNGPTITKRHLSIFQAQCSGHNRWSKIKHDKGKKDAIMNKARSIFAAEIATASRLFGPEPGSNPRLADLITKAKRDGFAKTSIEAAIARGQGRSVTGASLEGVTIEAIMHNVGIIIECETDSKGRTLQQIKSVIKGAGGAASPANFLFSKTGRITLEEKDDVTAEAVLDAALEAGAKDVDDLTVYAEPGETKSVGDAVSKALGLDISTSEVVWVPVSETVVDVSQTVAQELCSLVDKVREADTSVQSIAMNIGRGDVNEETWQDLQDRLG